MNLKMSRAEFSSLYLLLNNTIEVVEPKGIQAIALHGLLRALYKKFYYRAFDDKRKYSVPFTDAEACAFYMFFSKHPMTGEDIHTVNLVLQINNSINQKFA